MRLNFASFLTAATLQFLHVANAFDVPDGVCKLSLATYTGGWYELAASNYVRSVLENDCLCPSAYYTLNAGNDSLLDLTNSCIRDGEFWSVTGQVYPLSDQPEGNLRVEIDQRQNGQNGQNGQDGHPCHGQDDNGNQDNEAEIPNYIVLKLYYENDDPQFSLVGGHDENYWWLLGRSPEWNQSIWDNAIHVLQANQYNITDHGVPEHSCLFLGRHGANNLIPLDRK
jgi:lipocalin